MTSVPKGCNAQPMDEVPDAADVPEAVEVTELEAPPAESAPKVAVDPVHRIMATTGLGLAVLALAELLGTITVGLAVNVDRMNFPTRQGYAFLTQLEKSPVGLVLIVAAALAAIATLRSADPKLSRAALWVAVGAGVLLGLGTLLSVMARFRVADLAASQPVDSLTRRVLVVFVIRNFGAAVLAVSIAAGALFQKRTAD